MMFKLLFTWNGRINREKYWQAVFTLFLVSTLVIGLTKFFLPEIQKIILKIIRYLYIYPTLCYSAKRLRDLDKPPIIAAILLVPYIKIPLGIYIGFTKGTDGPNKYGPDPLHSVIQEETA